MNKITKGVIGLSLAASMFSCESESISPNKGENLTIVSETDSGLLKSRYENPDYDEYKEHLSYLLGIDIEEIVSFASFQNDLGLDSLDFVVLLIDLEDEYEIELIDLIRDEILSYDCTVIELWMEIYRLLD